MAHQSETLLGLMPQLTVSDAPAAIAFYTKAFGAKEVMRHTAPNGTKVMHCRMDLLDCVLMINDDFPEFAGGKSRTPEGVGGCGVVFHLQVEDGVDALCEKAIGAGAAATMPLKDQFWGDRYGQLMDPFGYTWSMGQTISKPTVEEVERAAEKAFH